jgi:hypothetical protein
VYEGLIAGVPDVERKGKGTPYTSMNGNMFSFMGQGGVLAFRLSKGERAAFLGGHPGAVMKDYVAVPDAVLEDGEALGELWGRCVANARTLKPKATTRRGGSRSGGARQARRGSGERWRGGVELGGEGFVGDLDGAAGAGADAAGAFVAGGGVGDALGGAVEDELAAAVGDEESDVGLADGVLPLGAVAGDGDDDVGAVVVVDDEGELGGAVAAAGAEDGEAVVSEVLVLFGGEGHGVAPGTARS